MSQVSNRLLISSLMVSKDTDNSRRTDNRDMGNNNRDTGSNNNKDTGSKDTGSKDMDSNLCRDKVNSRNSNPIPMDKTLTISNKIMVKIKVASIDSRLSFNLCLN